jgi:hypothetical protein
LKKKCIVTNKFKIKSKKKKKTKGWLDDNTSGTQEENYITAVGEVGSQSCHKSHAHHGNP